MEMSHKYELEKMELKNKISDIQIRLANVGNQEKNRNYKIEIARDDRIRYAFSPMAKIIVATSVCTGCRNSPPDCSIYIIRFP